MAYIKINADGDARSANQLSEDEQDTCAEHFRHARLMNIHESRTLDESYYTGLGSEQLSERNKDQVVCRYGKKRRLLMVSQLWLWKMGGRLISACGSHPHVGNELHGKNADEDPGTIPEDPSTIPEDPGTDPQKFLADEAPYGLWREKRHPTSLQLTALIFSECVNYLNRPYCAGLEEPVFSIYERAVGTLDDQVGTYLKKPMGEIQLNTELKFFHEISDIRDELNIIKSAIKEQREVWDQLYKDLQPSGDSEGGMINWSDSIRQIAIRPQKQIPHFLRQIQSIDENAQRVEQRIQVLLDLKKTHASLMETHNSTILSTTVIGFTIVTIVFTPLSFVATLLAVPDAHFTWTWKTGKKYMSKSTHPYRFNVNSQSCGRMCLSIRNVSLGLALPLVVGWEMEDW